MAETINGIDTTICTNPALRHDFILLFDVLDGNPNGDPDAGNQPRTDPETMHGLVTNVCLKRKVRNFVSLTQADQSPNRIYVQDKGVYLNELHKESHRAIGIADKDAKTPERAKRDKAREWMCSQFYDVRLFGAVMSTGVNAGQVRGPVQLTFSRSVDPVLPYDVAITRVALTNEKEKEAGSSESEGGSRTGTMGRKSLIPYGLYVGHGFFSAPFATQTGVTSADLLLFWQALVNMWDLDHSAARGMMACRGLYVFSHDNPLGNAPAHKLFDTLAIRKRDGVEAPRRFEDYTFDSGPHIPDGLTGVTLTSLVEG